MTAPGPSALARAIAEAWLPDNPDEPDRCDREWREDARAELAALIDQHPHVVAVLNALDAARVVCEAEGARATLAIVDQALALLRPQPQEER